MAWTAPMTAVANATFTAAQFNLYVRDNFNETAPAKATTAGRLFVTTGVNALAEREINEAAVVTSQSTTSTSATNLATVGPQVTVTTGTTALVLWSALITNNTAGSTVQVDFAVSGASTRAASDTTALKFQPSTNNYEAQMGTFHRISGLTPGANTFTLRYWCSGGTAFFAYRRIMVLGL